MMEFFKSPVRVFRALTYMLIGALIVVLYCVFMAPPAQAQTTAQSEANSAAQSASGSQSASLAQGGSVTFNTPSRQTVTQRGETTTRVENAPSLGGLSLGGSHPCQWSPFTGQISVIGGGLGGGGGTIDSACMLLVAAAASGDSKAYAAAMSMIAARDPAACKAMYQARMISDCVDKNGKSVVKAAPVVSTSNISAPEVPWTKCQKSGANQITIRYKAGADKTAAKARCMRALGY